MKRLVLSLILVCALLIDMKAQKSDGFFGYDSKYEIADGYKTYENDNLPIGNIANENNRAPLGNGILLLSAMGIAYCVGKYRHRH